RVRVLVRLDARAVTLEEWSREVLRRVRVDLPLHGLGEHEHLERRSRLAVAIDREVVGDTLPFLSDRHRLDLAGLGIDRDDGARGVALAPERADDRLRRLGLQLRVERREDPQAAATHSL